MLARDRDLACLGFETGERFVPVALHTSAACVVHLLAASCCARGPCVGRRTKRVAAMQAGVGRMPVLQTARKLAWPGACRRSATRKLAWPSMCMRSATCKLAWPGTCALLPCSPPNTCTPHLLACPPCISCSRCTPAPHHHKAYPAAAAAAATPPTPTRGAHASDGKPASASRCCTRCSASCAAACTGACASSACSSCCCLLFFSLAW